MQFGVIQELKELIDLCHGYRAEIIDFRVFWPAGIIGSRNGINPWIWWIWLKPLNSYKQLYNSDLMHVISVSTAMTSSGKSCNSMF
jgi:hypothetical protein